MPLNYALMACGGGAPPTFTVEATDDFNRGDSTSLGSNWTESGSAAFGISSNRLTHTGVGASVAIWNTQMSSDDHFVQFEQISTGVTRGIAAWLRGNGTTPTEGYQCAYSSSDAQWRIHRYTGSFTLIASVGGAGPAANDEVWSEVDGSVITIYVNDVSVLSFDDSAFGSGFAGNRYVGFRGFTSGTVDNFVAGILL